MTPSKEIEKIKKRNIPKKCDTIAMKNSGHKWGLHWRSKLFPLIPLLFSWDDHVNLRGERDFRQILAQTTPPPPHNVHINKNININNIGGQFFCRICLKVEFSSQKSEMLKFIVLDNQHCLNDILLKPASEQNWIKRMIMGKFWLQVVLYFVQGRSIIFGDKWCISSYFWSLKG